jgi:hypothetical protein
MEDNFNLEEENQLSKFNILKLKKIEQQQQLEI